MTCSCLKVVSSTAVHIFFTSVEVVHKKNIPKESPVLIVSNHNNQFIDAAMLLATIPRPVSFIIAEASMHRFLIGYLARLARSVPVVRPQDRAQSGSGEITAIDLETLTITGNNTSFQAKVEPGCKIDIRNVGAFTVKQVLNDTQVTFTLDDEAEAVKAQVEGLKKGGDKAELRLAYKVLPKVDQSEVYSAVHDRLAENSVIAVFPEGGSHDQTHLLPLKAGVAAMALGAVAKGVNDLKILPVGFNYFQAASFRSRVLVEVGEPITLSPELVSMYTSGDKQARRKAYEGVMEQVRQGMLNVTLNAPDYKTQQLLRTARRLYQNGSELTAARYLELYRRFLSGYEEWRHDEDFQALLKDISSYLKRAESLGLTDKNVQDLPPRNSCFLFMTTTLEVILSLLVLFIFCLFVLPGVLLNLPLYWVLTWRVNNEVKKALAKSKVKVNATDVAASQKVINTVKYLPMAYLFNALVTLLVLYFVYERNFAQPEDNQPFFIDNLFWIVPLILLFALPLYTFICVRVLESTYRRGRLLPMRVYTLYSIYRRHLPVCCGGAAPLSLSPQADVRLQRRNLVLKTQEVVKKLTEKDPVWQSDPILSADEMQNRRYILAQELVGLVDRKMSDRKILQSLRDPDILQALKEVSKEANMDIVPATV